MPRQTEPNANNALGSLLQAKQARCGPKTPRQSLVWMGDEQTASQGDASAASRSARLIGGIRLRIRAQWSEQPVHAVCTVGRMAPSHQRACHHVKRSQMPTTLWAACFRLSWQPGWWAITLAYAPTIVNAPGRSPVVVETEYLPARTVEPKAKSRLGLKVGANGRIIEAAIALRYPDTVSVKGGVIPRFPT